FGGPLLAAVIETQHHAAHRVDAIDGARQERARPLRFLLQKLPNISAAVVLYDPPEVKLDKRFVCRHAVLLSQVASRLQKSASYARPLLSSDKRRHDSGLGAGARALDVRAAPPTLHSIASPIDRIPQVDRQTKNGSVTATTSTGPPMVVH